VKAPGNVNDTKWRCASGAITTARRCAASRSRGVGVTLRESPLIRGARSAVSDMRGRSADHACIEGARVHGCTGAQVLCTSARVHGAVHGCKGARGARVHECGVRVRWRKGAQELHDARGRLGGSGVRRRQGAVHGCDRARVLEAHRATGPLTMCSDGFSHQPVGTPGALPSGTAPVRPGARAPRTRAPGHPCTSPCAPMHLRTRALRALIFRRESTILSVCRGLAAAERDLHVDVCPHSRPGGAAVAPD
jgi:hypothetical protein